MTDKHDKLVEAAQAAGFCYVGGTLFAHDIDLTPKLAAFASAHVASLCAGVGPVAFMFQHSETGRIAFVDAWQKENGWALANPRYSEVGTMHGASTVASLTAQRDQALARVAELEKDAQDRLDTVQAIFDAIGYTKEYAMQWPKEKASVTFKRWFDEQMRAALTKGQP